jgi:DNA-directed RNA polymerase III subunit RPC2
LRRCGLIDPFVSVSLQDSTRSVVVSNDGGRLCRPYIVVDEDGVPLLQEKHIFEMKASQRDFDSLIREGVIEFLDINELNNSNVAIYENEIEAGVTTHMEVID